MGQAHLYKNRVYEDRVYGQARLDDVIVELITTPDMQRLGGISQQGWNYLMMPRTNTSRLEHSIGVALLLKRLGAPQEEQIAGLLHDVPHSAFSHLADWVFDNILKEDYHERFKERSICSPHIHTVLERYGFDTKKILGATESKILDAPLPEICADRVDYCLRDIQVFGVLPRETKNAILDDLVVCDGELAFTGVEGARAFATNYMRADATIWRSPNTLAAMQIMSDVLRDALHRGAIKEADFFLTDDALYEKLRASGKSGDGGILYKLTMLTPNFKAVEDKRDYDWHIRAKVRAVDPKIKIKTDAAEGRDRDNNGVTRLSVLDDAYRGEMERFWPLVKKEISSAWLNGDSRDDRKISRGLCITDFYCCIAKSRRRSPDCARRESPSWFEKGQSRRGDLVFAGRASRVWRKL